MILLLPSEEYIEGVHEIVLQQYGGKAGVLHKEVLETVVHRPKNFVSYDECNLHKVCAVMVHTIAQDHPFTDANKRTALLTAILVYRLNGVHLELGEDINGEFTTLMLWIVNKPAPSIEEIAIQLQDIVERYAKSGIKLALDIITDYF